MLKNERDFGHGYKENLELDTGDNAEIKRNMDDPFNYVHQKC